MLRYLATRYRHWLWVSALCLSFLIPVATTYRAIPDSPSSVSEETFARELVNPVLSEEAPQSLSRTSAIPSSLSFQLNRGIALTLLFAYCAFLLFRGFRLAQAWQATRIIRDSAADLELDENVAEIIRRCETQVALDSGHVRGWNHYQD